jgi:hypothetical protein
MESTGAANGSVPRILVRCLEDQACRTIKHRTVVRSLVFVDHAGGSVPTKGTQGQLLQRGDRRCRLRLLRSDRGRLRCAAALWTRGNGDLSRPGASRGRAASRQPHALAELVGGDAAPLDSIATGLGELAIEVIVVWLVVEGRWSKA